jgi:DnaJ domain/Protein of unknown function (DUF3592)
MHQKVGSGAQWGAVADPRTFGDLYEELGIPRSATRDQVAAAFRARAKELHPDARPGDAAAAEQFKRVGAAYRVLVDPAQRARYDAGAAVAAMPRDVGSRPGPPPVPVPAPPRAGFRLTRRAARWAVGAGAALVVLGFVAGAFVVSLQRHDSDLRANGVATVATVVQVAGQRRLQFTAPGGHVVRATESVKSGEEQPPVGAQVPIHYDRTDPTNIVTDDSHAARDITLWIVAVKLAVGGAVLIWFGRRRLRSRLA